MDTARTVVRADHAGHPSDPIRMSLAQPTDVAIVQSIPSIGRMVAATLFAEAATLLRLRNYDPLCALSGLLGEPQKRDMTRRRNAICLQRAPPGCVLSLGAHRHPLRSCGEGVLRHPSASWPHPWASPQKRCGSRSQNSHGHAPLEYSLRSQHHRRPATAAPVNTLSPC